ncbi:hypothetical protein FA13DRAFT_1655832 [Coprinellus micaceus]|uniref:Chromatin modification-related protein n=1 Tax=Coprinellus micaceus TaxID=71717 RepID=A0A4Y7TWJ0_COPMI|nr:hypothetical protein FA13DRAFT_1655832 [Coprinellus micaceus]
MAPPRVQQQQYAPPLQPLPSGVEGEDQLSTAYSLLLLSEYNHTLDSLPLDLSRNFADLRELDAVLSSSMQSITTKIAALTTMIEEGTVPKDQRLWLLHDIAEEAGRLKLGGEDKIRVACQAADNLRAHNTHLRTLTDTLPGFDTSVLIRKTQYPHVSPQSFMPVHTTEHGRRRRNQHGSLLTINQSTTDPSPAKRKRVVNAREEDIDIGSIKSPRKEQATTTGRGRVNNRVKKANERATSPAESVLSANYRQNSGTGRTTASTSRAGASASTNKRRTGGSNRNGTPLEYTNSNGYDNRGGGNNYNGVLQNNGFAANGVNGSHQQIMQAYDMNMHIQDWNAGQPLAGPGMPVSRNVSAAAAAAAAQAQQTAAMVVDDVDGTDADAEDNKRYCFCKGVSYGEMVACDGEACEGEWFHYPCVGLNSPPSGDWYCDDCKAKQNIKRTGRGGKRRAGGGRAGAKS